MPEMRYINEALLFVLNQGKPHLIAVACSYNAVLE
jgi:hypothetical protein